MIRTGSLQSLVLAGALALGVTSPARAQDAAAQQDGQQAGAQEQGRRGRGQGGGAGGFARNPTQAVEQYQTQVNELDLNAEQKTKLAAIFKDAGEQAKTVATEAESLQGRERNQKVMGFQRELREKVAGVLTDEQKQTLRKNNATRQAKQMTQRYRRATADLGLSEDQKAKVETVLADTEKKAAEAAPVADGGGRARGGQFREITQETRDKISALLTAEQKTKFEEATRQRQGGGRGRGGQGGNQQ